ncbi:MAG: helix-turn-helix transcriptional regulator [Gammaproteobacteria bacterium]|nr:helix-turn-helix transcriptional regulator [Gammaproteobacteria bacterium]
MFGTLLKDWRGQRRMSQLELGMAANVSARHISFLETGRAKPSQPMVLQLSETLTIPRNIRNRLLRAAGFSSAYSARDLNDQELEYVRAAMDWTLQRHNPFPAVAFDRHWRILKMNTCATALLGALNIGDGDSLLDAFANDGPVRSAISNWPEVASHMVARLRTESAHLGGDAVLDAGIAKLSDALGSEKIEQYNELPAVITADYVSNGLTLSFFSTISQFGSTEDIALADVKIELMFPANAETRDALVASFT